MFTSGLITPQRGRSVSSLLPCHLYMMLSCGGLEVNTFILYLPMEGSKLTHSYYTFILRIRSELIHTIPSYGGLEVDNFTLYLHSIPGGLLLHMEDLKLTFSLSTFIWRA